MNSSEIYWSLSKEKKNEIADNVRRQNLEIVNANCKPVNYNPTYYEKYVKRGLDIIISFIAITITLPINVIILIVTFFDVGRPIFFPQIRIGRNNKAFTLKKFRNMTNEKDENGVLLPPEKRVTSFGKFVRKTSLDELLGFWNVLKGDMSIIGPRPLPEVYLDRYSDRHLQRHLVRPGLECPQHDAKLQGAKTWESRLENDIWYVENINFKTDLLMVWLLVKEVLLSKENNVRATGQSGSFLGYHEDGRVMTSEDIPREYLLKVLDKV